MGLEWSWSEVERTPGAISGLIKLLKTMWMKNLEGFDMPSKAKMCSQSPRLLPILGGTWLHQEKGQDHAKQEACLPGGPDEEAKKHQVKGVRLRLKTKK